MGNKQSRSAGGDGGEAVARFIASKEANEGEKQKPPTPVHLEIFGTPNSGKRTLSRAITLAESFVFEEQPEDVQKLLRRQVQFTAAAAALRVTARLSESPQEREDLQKIVDQGINAVVNDDKQFKAMFECLKRFVKNDSLRSEIDKVQNGNNPVISAPFVDFEDMKKIFSSHFVPLRRHLLSIALPDSDLTKVEHVTSSCQFYPLEISVHPSKDVTEVPKPPKYPYYIIFTVSLMQMFDNKEEKDSGSPDKKGKGNRNNSLVAALKTLRSFVQTPFMKNAKAFFLVLTCSEQFSCKFMNDHGYHVMKKVFKKYEDGKNDVCAMNYICDEFVCELNDFSNPKSVIFAELLDVFSNENETLSTLLKPVTVVASEYGLEAEKSMQAEVAAALLSSGHKKNIITVPVSTEKCKLELKSGAITLKGLRKTNEDTMINYDDFTLTDTKLSGKASVYGIFDGHGGSKVASECCTVVPKTLFAQSSFPADPVAAFTAGFAEADEELKRVPEKSGSTCALATVLGNTLIVGNIGDTEAVLAQLVDDELRFTLLTHKHSVTDPEEVKRIEKIGQVIMGERIMGSLSVARAFGDVNFKSNGKAFVSIEPYVSTRALHPEDQFIILGCDGLWDIIPFREAISVVHRMRGQGKEPKEVAEALGNLALKRGSEDNVTVIVIYLNWEGHSVSAPAKEAKHKKPSAKQEPEEKEESAATAEDKPAPATDDAKDEKPSAKKEPEEEASTTAEEKPEKPKKGDDDDKGEKHEHHKHHHKHHQH